MELVTLETPSLGDRSYVLLDGEAAAVIDAQRDIDRVIAILDERGARLTHVFETHVHNDYVTGGFELAQRSGATYVLPAEDDVAFERSGAAGGDEYQVGTLVIRAIRTPGHTPTHLSYAVSKNGEPVAVFTGGSMLYGTVGRTDLIGADATEGLTREQFRSVRRLATELPRSVGVHPTHGFGSFCSSAATSGSDASTIGQERETNLALLLDDEDEFVERLLAGLTAYPRYYAHMAPINRRGPQPVNLSPPEPVDAEAIRERVDGGEWVVDLRNRTAFARGHAKGTVNIEVGRFFTTYLGWTLPWGAAVTLVGDTEEEVAEAQRQMVRIGIDRPAGAAIGGVDAWGRATEIRSYRAASFEDLADRRATGSVVVVDVRRDDEWAEGRIPDAVHIPLHHLKERMAEVPEGEVWVHCASGYRASIAASLVDGEGREVVVIHDDWENAAKLEALGVSGHF